MPCDRCTAIADSVKRPSAIALARPRGVKRDDAATAKAMASGTTSTSMWPTDAPVARPHAASAAACAASTASIPPWRSGPP